MLNLRGMASETWACPLYGDQIELTEDFTSGLGGSVFSLYCEPLLRRFPAGIRIAVVNLDPSGDVNWVHFTQVLNRYTDRLDVSSDMPYDTLAGRTLIYPCLDMEPVATASVKHISSTKAIVNVTAQEMIGDSALPPSWTGIATGFGSYDGLPIFAPDHNWVTSLDSKYSMDGSLYNQGRGKIIDLRGAHPRLTQKFNLQLNRTDAYRMLNFFDSRLGRAIPFWTIDSEDLWEVDAVATGYVDITAVGDFTKMQEDFDYVGLKFYEDESQVKAIHSFQDNGATWRIVLDDNLPSGLSVNNVLYCSRARKSRFLKDSLSEVWVNDGICEIMVQTIELLQEGSVSL